MENLIRVQLTLYVSEGREDLVDIFSVKMNIRPQIGDVIDLSCFVNWYDLDMSMKENYKKYGINSRNYSSMKFKIYKTMIFPSHRGTDISCKLYLL